jgi:hypothetical protein
MDHLVALVGAVVVAIADIGRTSTGRSPIVMSIARSSV